MRIVSTKLEVSAGTGVKVDIEKVTLDEQIAHVCMYDGSESSFIKPN